MSGVDKSRRFTTRRSKATMIEMKVSGTVSRVFFCNAESPFMAGVLKEDTGTTVRFSAKCSADVGDLLELTGEWKTHPKFGMQFEASAGLVKMDQNPEALERLLAAHDDFEGVGPAKAKRIVEAAVLAANDGYDMGEGAIGALIHKTLKIAEISGLPYPLIQSVGSVLCERQSHFETLALLNDQGWSNAQSTRIAKKLGVGAPSMVKSNPYMLIGKLARFGFRTVDTVAIQMGISSTDPQRLAAGVGYCLDKIASDGNTWTTRAALLDHAVDELRPDTLDGEDKIRETIQSLVDTGLIYVDVSPNGVEIVADAYMAKVEIEVFKKLTEGLQDDAVQTLDLTRSSITSTLNNGQSLALHGFSSHRFGVISGGAGVGKTYLMDAVCQVAKSNGLGVALCAPTGKAARKLSHATRREAKTIHRLLEPKFDNATGSFYFTANEQNPLEFDLVVVDEISMVDVRLMRSLLAALKPTARLLLVGDHNQIPSVGPGAILRDILAGKASYPGAVHVLTEIVRQAGVLARNTTAILDGIVAPDISSVWGTEKTERGHPTAVAAKAAELVEFFATQPDLDPFKRQLSFDWDIQVLAPMRKGPMGTWALNTHLQILRQRMLGNPPPPPVKEGTAPKPQLGDRIIWTKNDYELGLLNGTQAIVMAFPKGGGMKLHTEDGADVDVPGAKRDRAQVAYAMTIHKAQGSEWPCIILVASSSHAFMHDRNLFYTGASRAAESLTILGDSKGMHEFARKQRSAKRQTFGSYLVQGWVPGAYPLPDAVAAGGDVRWAE